MIFVVDIKVTWVVLKFLKYNRFLNRFGKLIHTALLTNASTISSLGRKEKLLFVDLFENVHY